MRLICTIPENSDENPYEFSYFLTTEKIPNECEEFPGPNGESLYHIWVVDEDQVEKAQELYRKYHKNPKDPRFRIHDDEAIRAQEEKLLKAENKEKEPLKSAAAPLRRSRVLSPAPYGKVTSFILLLAIFLFVWTLFQKGVQAPPKLKNVAQAPIFPPIEKALLYDYPHYFELRDQLLSIYTPKEIEEGKTPPQEAKILYDKILQTTYWQGFYELVVARLQNKVTEIDIQAPLFEKISKGQVWRLITPIFLHFDLLHIFFNLLWFIMLGNQIEFRIGIIRYILLIVLTALISNVAQYLMSGPFFMGLSGVVCGMAAFIWARQQVAPWEGYLLHRLTLVFLAIFVFGMFAIQIVFFFLQITGSSTFNVSIANTAHLMGGLVGYILGRFRFFALHHKKA